MDKRTRKALEESIKHWEENAAATCPDEVNISSGVCALCNMFRRQDSLDCYGCPVAMQTGKQYCDGTPYTYVVQAKRVGTTLAKMSEHIEAELAFLKSLRFGDSAQVDSTQHGDSSDKN